MQKIQVIADFPMHSFVMVTCFTVRLLNTRYWTAKVRQDKFPENQPGKDPTTESPAALLNVRFAVVEANRA